MVRRHLLRHDNDPERSLAELSSIGRPLSHLTVARARRPGRRVGGTRRRAASRGGAQGDQERCVNEEQPGLRFSLEAEITGGLEHPGIVPVYGLGHHPAGRPFYAMRFVRGEPGRAGGREWSTPSGR